MGNAVRPAHLVGEDEILRREWFAVVPGNPLAQVEHHTHAAIREQRDAAVVDRRYPLREPAYLLMAVDVGCDQSFRMQFGHCDPAANRRGDAGDAHGLHAARYGHVERLGSAWRLPLRILAAILRRCASARART